MCGFVCCFYTPVLKIKRSNYGVALSVCLSVCKQSARYLHDISEKCILGQDNVYHTEMIVPTFLVSE